MRGPLKAADTVLPCHRTSVLGQCRRRSFSPWSGKTPHAPKPRSLYSTRGAATMRSPRLPPGESPGSREDPAQPKKKRDLWAGDHGAGSNRSSALPQSHSLTGPKAPPSGSACRKPVPQMTPGPATRRGSWPRSTTCQPSSCPGGWFQRHPATGPQGSGQEAQPWGHSTTSVANAMSTRPATPPLVCAHRRPPRAHAQQLRRWCVPTGERPRHTLSIIQHGQPRAPGGCAWKVCTHRETSLRGTQLCHTHGAREPGT